MHNLSRSEAAPQPSQRQRRSARDSDSGSKDSESLTRRGPALSDNRNRRDEAQLVTVEHQRQTVTGTET